MKRRQLLALCLGILGAPAANSQGYVANVPDIVVPPQLPAFLVNGNNWCTPTAASNIVVYWNANGSPGVAGGFVNRSVAGQLGWFMDTNDQTGGKGVAADGHLGTWEVDPRGSGFDAVSGIFNWARWNPALTTFGVNNVPYPGATPGAKVGYPWIVTRVLANGYLDATTEINAGRPLISNFTHWDMFFTGLTTLVNGVQTQVWDFREPHAGSVNGSTSEGSWSMDFGLGHSVTTVGYVNNFNYQGQNVNLLVVHDTIPAVGNGYVTPLEIAVPFDAHWKSNIDVNPVPEPATFVALIVGSAALILRRRSATRR